MPSAPVPSLGNSHRGGGGMGCAALGQKWGEEGRSRGRRVNLLNSCSELFFLTLVFLVHPNNHGRMNYKDTKPYMSAFLSVDLLTDFSAFCLTDFIDWRYIHSWFVFSTQLVNCCPQRQSGFPHGRRNYTCVRLPPYCAFSLTSSPLPLFPMYSMCRP